MTASLAETADLLRATGMQIELISPLSLQMGPSVEDVSGGLRTSVTLSPSDDELPSFVQFVTICYREVPPESVADLLAALNAVNLAASVGAFVLNEEREVVFRHAIPVTLPELTDLLSWVAPFMDWQAQRYAGYLQGLLAGEISLETLDRLLLDA